MNANSGVDGLTVWNSLPKDMWYPKLVAHSFRRENHLCQVAGNTV